ncbi:MAG: hypothetical protein CFH35_00544 [Alphaproteobacteria bacterium MarineAlpha9_Bin5]|nr:MAG: hypothetical protein CFH36_01073 [Alphaproteobacteria bacterium MarineAlpha9_Bin6]PPR39428.1 MAG: hypothetical protein CFH35_00544 [Alphaproteobacteria bacterium MarineAlpha9_Bin5]
MVFILRSILAGRQAEISVMVALNSSKGKLAMLLMTKFCVIEHFLLLA